MTIAGTENAHTYPKGKEHTCTCLTAYRFNCLPFLQCYFSTEKSLLQWQELKKQVMKFLVKCIYITITLIKQS